MNISEIPKENYKNYKKLAFGEEILRAVQMNDDFNVVNKDEETLEGNAGDFILDNGKKQWVVYREKFLAEYFEIDPKTNQPVDMKAYDNLVWAQFLEQEIEDTQHAYEDEICSCYHGHDSHYAGDGFCQVKGCQCSYFGQLTEEYEEYPKGTNVGGEPGGFMIYD